MKRMILTNEQITLLDDEDFVYLSQYKCGANYNNRLKEYYAYVRISGETKSMHRIVLERKLGRQIKPKYVCDHKNGDTLDNRRKNLREVTHSFNIFNSKVQSNNKLGVKGITFIEYRNKYRASIHYKRKWYHLGYYSTLKEAVAVREVAEKIFYGENVCNKR